MKKDLAGPWHYDYIRLAWDSGFCFVSQKGQTAVDLGSLGLVDVDRTVLDRDIAVLEKHIPTIVEYVLDEEQTRILDATFVKVFKLSQLSLQYLLFCKKYLDNSVTVLKKEIAKSNEESKNMLQELEDMKSENAHLKRKVKELKQILEYQPVMLENTFRCQECPKVFATEEFLSAHMQRRHDNSPRLQTETDKLQLEIKQLKERLNCTEKFMQNDQHEVASLKLQPLFNPENENRMRELQAELEKLKLQLENQEKIIDDQKAYQNKYEKWMEMAFLKFEGNNKPKCEEKLAERRDSYTQTAETPKTDTVEEEGKNELESISADFGKMQLDMEANTRSRFEKLEGLVEQKVADNFEKFSHQMDAFWGRLNEAETKKEHDLLEQLEANQKESRRLEQQNLKLTQLQRQNEQELRMLKEKKEEASKDVAESPQLQEYQEGITQGGKRAGFRTENDVLKESNTKQEKPSEKEEESDGMEVVHLPPKPHPRVSKVLSPPVTINRGVSFHEEAMSEEHKYPQVTVIRAVSNIESSEAEESSADSEDVSDVVAFEPVTRPSGTSTLGQRSITSLKKASLDEDVAKGLSKELEEVLAVRLKNLGVSPEWKTIPARSFQKAMKIVKHQAALSSKNLHNYRSIKKEILKEVNARALEQRTISVESGGMKIKARTKVTTRKASLPTVAKPQKTAKLQRQTKSETIVPMTMYASSEESASSVLKPVVSLPQDQGSGDAKTRKKVLFDLESLDSHSEEVVKKPLLGVAPVYMDELKSKITVKTKESDTSAASSILDDLKDLQKDKDTSDWDLSEFSD